MTEICKLRDPTLSESGSIHVFTRFKSYTILDSKQVPEIQSKMIDWGIRKRSWTITKNIKLNNSIYELAKIKKEQIYQTVVDWKITTDENCFPLELKVEFLKELFILFNDKEHHSRSTIILKALEELYLQHKIDSNIERLYLEWVLSLNINMVVFKDM